MRMKKPMIWVQLFLWAVLPGAQAHSQEIVQVPDYFIRMENPAQDLKQKISAAANHARGKDQTFWFGYQFDLRAGVDFYYDAIYINEDGGITITRGGQNRLQMRDEDDLKTHVLHALSELGDEDAREKLEARLQESPAHAKMQIGLFLQTDAKSKRPQKLRLLNLTNAERLRQHPVYWFGKVENRDSFEYLTEIVQNNDYPQQLRKPAIFVISLHNHPQVVPFLTKVAGSERLFELRKSAIFWLGQIPTEESFDALADLFDKEKDGQLKEKIVFSLSQHQSAGKLNKLAEISKNRSEDLGVREKAVFWLGQIDREESLDLLQDILKNSESRELREKAIFAISQHKSKRAAPLLIQVAKSEPDRQIRQKAIFWIGQMAGQKTLEALGDIVASDDETEVKTRAVFAISQHSDKDKAIEMLMNIAKTNPNPQVRKKAIFWLSQTGDERALDFFKQILTEK